MASRYGATHGLPGYDAVKTGLTFSEVKAMLWSASDDPADWRRKSRGCVLGLWHRIKMDLYQQMCEIRESETA